MLITRQSWNILFCASLYPQCWESHFNPTAKFATSTLPPRARVELKSLYIQIGDWAGKYFPVCTFQWCLQLTCLRLLGYLVCVSVALILTLHAISSPIKELEHKSGVPYFSLLAYRSTPLENVESYISHYLPTDLLHLRMGTILHNCLWADISVLLCMLWESRGD